MPALSYATKPGFGAGGTTAPYKNKMCPADEKKLSGSIHFGVQLC